MVGRLVDDGRVRVGVLWNSRGPWKPEANMNRLGMVLISLVVLGGCARVFGSSTAHLSSEEKSAYAKDNAECKRKVLGETFLIRAINRPFEPAAGAKRRVCLEDKGWQLGPDGSWRRPTKTSGLLLAQYPEAPTIPPIVCALKTRRPDTIDPRAPAGGGR